MRRILSVLAMFAAVSMLMACGSSGSDNGGTDTIPDTIIGNDNLPTDPGKYDPGTPGDSGQPNDPGTPYDPGQPNDPGTPYDPGQPDDPGTPYDPGGTPPDEGSCKWYFSCSSDCPPQPQGQACLQECQAGLSPAGQADVEGLFNCLEVNGCQNKATDEEWSQCLSDFCLDPYFTCFSGNLYATCPDLVGCINDCPDDNPATPDVNEQSVCIGNCWGEGTVDAQWSLQNLIDCMYDTCTTCGDDWEGQICQDCLNDVLGTDGLCEALNEACMSFGDWNCGQVFECVTACMDNACVQDCFGNATKMAGEKYNTMIACALDACPQCETTPPGEDCDACFNAAINQDGACFAETTACVDDAGV